MGSFLDILYKNSLIFSDYGVPWLVATQKFDNDSDFISLLKVNTDINYYYMENYWNKGLRSRTNFS